jgi:hypothetical protein
MLRDGREHGAVTLSLHALSLLRLDHFVTGEWDALEELADEHVRLCRAHNYQLLECVGGPYQRAMLAAARGEDTTTQALTDQMTRWATPRGIGLILRLAAQARMLSALTGGDVEAAYPHATTITQPGELADHVPHALWMTLDLTEAAVRTGRHTEATAHVAALRQADVAAISPRQALTFEGASSAPGSSSPTASDCAG